MTPPLKCKISFSTFLNINIINIVEKLIKQAFWCKRLIENPIYVRSENGNILLDGCLGNSHRTEIPKTREIPKSRGFLGISHVRNSWEGKFEIIQAGGNGNFLLNISALDNQFAAPYNHALALCYRCHINVEVCATVRSVKYLHKYMYKGPDRAAVELQAPDAAAAETAPQPVRQ